ncbi:MULTISPECIES: LysR family transcriptional regulator [Rhodopseudomonas]|uniref:LysR family transcriptional regulator n=1 Tax=Rhodopseudomonas palustris TaxID=1076 RepID=A0A0D7ETE8_RHOPL|nr:MULTISPECIES: LysR family transcriptional regulator [Rhodopseudomonas]KIZ44078.1 LysR family transcriptional regulator [Rhodopseudomonas palustris]MDF3812410.1 LysR family transcriptional regulator [Rhodopseudomonas sp. BAL398]WOK17257.1 LysR family transcriptional regulator [Rhodopseudomonas sp. BAL398]
MIESTALKYFREVTLRGSIKQAAESLHIAPSAISRQVQGLEDELSVKLFERGARGMSLTDAGHLLYRYAIDNQSKLDRIRAQVEEFEALHRGNVRLATVEGLLASFVSDFVVDMSRDYPGISISVTTVGSSGVAEMVGRQDVDLGLVFGRAPRHDLIELARMRQSLCLMVAPHHPFADKGHCAVKDLAGLRVILPDRSFGIRQEIDRACAKANVQLDLYGETNSIAFLRTMAARANVGTFLPRDAALQELTAGRLVAVPLRDKRLEATQVTLVRLATRDAAPSGLLVAQLLVDRMKARKT